MNATLSLTRTFGFVALIAASISSCTLTGYVVHSDDESGADGGDGSNQDAAEPTALMLTSLNPPAGPTAGSIPVDVLGSGFSSGCEVKFGEAAPVRATSSSSSRLTVTLPPYTGNLMGVKFPLAIDVSVDCGNGRSKSLARSFRYYPAISPSLTPIQIDDGDGNLNKPVLVKAVDINGDAKLDIVTAKEDGSLGTVILWNDTTKAFDNGNPIRIGRGTYPAVRPRALMVGEINGNTSVDLLILCPVPTAKSVLFRVFDVQSLKPNSMVEYLPIAGGQFDNVVAATLTPITTPRIDDLITSEGSELHVYLNKGTGLFDSTMPEIKLQTVSHSMLAVDLDHTEPPDVVAARESQNDVAILLGTGRAKYKPLMHAALPGNTSRPWNVVAADFNGDNNQDLAVYSRGNAAIDPVVKPSVTILLNDGRGNLTASMPIILDRFSFPSDNDLTSLKAGDINGDGFPDLAFAQENQPDNIYLFLSCGKPIPECSPAPVPTPWPLPGIHTDVDVADINNDGLADVVAPTYAANGATYVLLTVAKP